MITREQIEDIQAEGRERGISITKLLDEKGIAPHQYFWWKRKHVREVVSEGFVPVACGMPPAVTAAAMGAGARGKSKSAPAGENWMSIELRTIAGTDMRIHGGLTPAMVYTILRNWVGNVVLHSRPYGSMTPLPVNLNHND